MDLKNVNFLQAGLSGRVPVIQARIRAEGRDFDEHISEFIRVGCPLTSDMTFEKLLNIKEESAKICTVFFYLVGSISPQV